MKNDDEKNTTILSMILYIGFHRCVVNNPFGTPSANMLAYCMVPYITYIYHSATANLPLVVSSILAIFPSRELEEEKKKVHSKSSE